MNTKFSDAFTNFLSNKNSGTTNALEKDSRRLPGRKRLQRPPDSDSESETPVKLNEQTSLAPEQPPPASRPKLDFTVAEKEQRYLSASKIAPLYDSMDIQDALLRTNWDVSACIKYLKTNYKPKSSSVLPSILNGTAHSSVSASTAFGSRPNSELALVKKNKKRHGGDGEDYKDDNDSEDGAYKKTTGLVYDSESDDDSGTERNTKGLKKKQIVVFDFFNTAELKELVDIKSCSEKKALLLMELRPFHDWNHLVSTLKTQKFLTTELLNNCHELLAKRRNLATVLQKCNRLIKRIEIAIESGAGITEQPSILNRNFKLAEYQLIGLNWLAVMHNENMNGILADEMGLGKTIQVIAFLAHLVERKFAKGTHLIVVPSSTMDNWESEIRKWCPQLTIEKYYGSQEERRAMRVRYAKYGFEGIDILLTTYHTVGSQPEERKMFRVMKLHYVIFDEAHMLKNMTTQRYQQLMTINAERRILLTGTPLQNNLLELMSLLCFVMPSFFAKTAEDFKSLFQKKIKISSNSGESEDSNSFEQEQVDQAKRIMKPFVLRRLKKDVLKYLPSKTEYVNKIAMADVQREYYNTLVQSYSNASGVVKGSTEIAGMAIMMHMRKLANHPLLLRYYFKDEDVMRLAGKLARHAGYKKTNTDYIFEDIAFMSDFQLLQLAEKYEITGFDIPPELIVSSGKFEFFDKLLPGLKADGHRCLIFSQFTMMLDVIERYLDIRDHGYCRLDGQTVVTDRQELINQFNENSNIFIFLLSTRAGGMGINLTAADTAIIHDIDFNPYNDKQAEDRCHRMGQAKPVSIYRLVSEGTIEEGMLMVAQEKLELEREINSTEKDDVREHKCMVKLLTMSLGLDQQRAETLLSSPPPAVGKSQQVDTNDF